jgi:hypothetical protein
VIAPALTIGLSGRPLSGARLIELPTATNAVNADERGRREKRHQRDEREKRRQRGQRQNPGWQKRQLVRAFNGGAGPDRRRPGQPAFAGTWGPAGEEQVPGFWKDPFGTVHLEGQAGRTGATGDTIFTLPPGYRPSANDYFAVYPSSGDGEASVAVLADGTVELFFLSEPSDDEFVGLTNISFRAAGS